MVVRRGGPERLRSLPVARSRYEVLVRKVIGGGELQRWNVDSHMYRGGGNSVDALRLLAQARVDEPGKRLSEVFVVRSARLALDLPCNLDVPDGPNCVRMKNFNSEATAGPFLRAFGVARKMGLKHALEDLMWELVDGYGAGLLNDSQLPFFGARVGFRTKLLKEGAAWEKVTNGEAVGRAVMMMDALEQSASSPLYNVLSDYTFMRRNYPESSFRNGTIRASSDWGKLWAEVNDAKVVVELDWSKFDRERPAADLAFLIQVIISCFSPKTPRERRLLKAYEILLRRALIERVVITDGGGAFMLDGMVPSGSLWTSWVDTALNILYIKAVCLELGLPSSEVSPKCAGDDNLTLFKRDPGDARLKRMHSLLNEWFRAGIKDEDFFIHRPPFHVRKAQAVFPPGTNLEKGTSGLLKDAKWVEFEGELIMDREAGLSHRWQYVFSGTPKFLSNHWLADGRSIRPAADNLEKLLWPEGIHTDLEAYENAVISMVVDNPWNHHNINHMMMRYVIIKQAEKVTVPPLHVEDTLWLSKIRAKGEEEVPFPMIAPWRRGGRHGRMEDYIDVGDMVEEFSAFVAGVTSLYARDAHGGLDAWMFMDILRGDSAIGEGQYGNDLKVWLDFLKSNPLGKGLRAVKALRMISGRRQPAALLSEEAKRAIAVLRDRCLQGSIRSSEEYGAWVCDLIDAQCANAL